jgi:hypothetical protein
MADAFQVLAKDHEEVMRMLAELQRGRRNRPAPARTSWHSASG